MVKLLSLKIKIKKPSVKKNVCRGTYDNIVGF